MKNKTKRLTLIFVLIIVFVISSDLFAVERSKVGFGNNHFIGGRFGAWTMTTNEGIIDTLNDFSSGALYLEFFYNHRIASFLSGEVSIGLFSQGDLEYESGTGTTIGAVKLYPFFLSAKLYPLSKYKNISLWPYLRIGGGVVHGTRDVTSAYSAHPVNYYVEETQTKITYTWGFGIDWPIADQIGLNIDFKNTPVKFGKHLAGLKEYSGWTLTVGVGYIMRSK